MAAQIITQDDGTLIIDIDGTTRLGPYQDRDHALRSLDMLISERLVRVDEGLARLEASYERRSTIFPEEAQP